MSKKDTPAEGLEDNSVNDDPAAQTASGWTENTGNDAGDPLADDLDIDPVEQLLTENADLKDQLLRSLAEMENVRRRSDRQVKDANIYAVSNFARDTLVIGDNLRRTIDAVPPEARAENEALGSLLEGVELTERELQKTLEKHGVHEIVPDGDKFDPNFHQAMFEVENPDIASGTIIQVVQAGYVIGERVLRPAMVGIAKGGPKYKSPSLEDEDVASGPDTQPDMSRDEATARSEEAQAEAAKAKEPPIGSRIDKSA